VEVEVCIDERTSEQTNDKATTAATTMQLTEALAKVIAEKASVTRVPARYVRGLVGVVQELVAQQGVGVVAPEKRLVGSFVIIIGW
jgi:hypothetical protein